ncbi:MAG: septum formation inhibitor Maf [Acidobacteria bacterium]|nr:septum formation inhibitor Maf [Acidobacteriota bacterium]
MLVLASQSPRRREILSHAGIPFIVRAAEVDESVLPGEAPQSYVRRLATAKAAAVPIQDGETVLAADTTVVVDNQILGKPDGDADAARMLRLLSGRSHEVVTGICLRRGMQLIIDAAVTEVVFSPLSDEQIRDYISTGEPQDKAGAYGIQGLAARYIERIDGCYFNVVGLPVSLVWRHLQR